MLLHDGMVLAEQEEEGNGGFSCAVVVEAAVALNDGDQPVEGGVDIVVSKRIGGGEVVVADGGVGERVGVEREKTGEVAHGFGLGGELPLHEVGGPLGLVERDEASEAEAEVCVVRRVAESLFEQRARLVSLACGEESVGADEAFLLRAR